MVGSKVFPILGGMVVVGGTIAAVAAFGQERKTVTVQDMGKAAIEFPTKQVLAATTSQAATNPKVEAGLVRWHPDFAAACEAAKKSKKPVLLFQMMGRLDEQFC